jgi:hypothetical protein
MVRTVTVMTKREVAVHAKDLEAWRESVLLEPVVDVHSVPGISIEIKSVCGSGIADVVDRQELDVSLSTTGTSWSSIMREDFSFHLEVILVVALPQKWTNTVFVVFRLLPTTRTRLESRICLVWTILAIALPRLLRVVGSVSRAGCVVSLTATRTRPVTLISLVAAPIALALHVSSRKKKAPGCPRAFSIPEERPSGQNCVTCG